jgi:3-oxoacyl-(acyl-carrier-protein) synthase
MALPKVFLVGMGTAGRAEEFSKKIQTAQQDPAFRKASRNMIAANLAIETAVSSAHLNTADLKESAFILGSSYGELESTTEFLKNWVGSKLARPMIFQSSLHNGTLGFLALHLGLKGPSFTVSQQFFTGERSLELAFDLIRGEVVESALVAAVDIMNPELMPALIPHLPENFRWEDGASAVLLASEKFILEKNLKMKKVTRL